MLNLNENCTQASDPTFLSINRKTELKSLCRFQASEVSYFSTSFISKTIEKFLHCSQDEQMTFGIITPYFYTWHIISHFQKALRNL